MSGKTPPTLRRRLLLTFVALPGLLAAVAGLIYAGVAWLELSEPVKGMAIYLTVAGAVWFISEVWTYIPDTFEKEPPAIRRRRWLLTLAAFSGLWLAPVGLTYAGVALGAYAQSVATVAMYFATIAFFAAIACILDWEPRAGDRASSSPQTPAVDVADRNAEPAD